MISKTLTFEGVDGQEHTQTFYFHFNEIELGEKNLEYRGIEDKLAELTQANDIAGAYNLFKDLLLSGYGVKAADGIGFDKIDTTTGAPLKYKLLGSPALGEMIKEMLNEPFEASKFFAGMLPGKAGKEALARIEAQEAGEEPAPKDDTLVYGQHTRKELLDMSGKEFRKIAGDNPLKMDRVLLEIAQERRSLKDA